VTVYVTTEATACGATAEHCDPLLHEPLLRLAVSDGDANDMVAAVALDVHRRDVEESREVRRAADDSAALAGDPRDVLVRGRQQRGGQETSDETGMRRLRQLLRPTMS